MNGLVVQDLAIEYGSGGYAVRPIDGFSMHAATGTLSLLLGPSGCGKTSLLSAIAGILSPVRGRIALGATDVTELSGPALNQYRREQVGIVFQAFNLVPSLSALENVMVPLRAAGRSRTVARARASELLERVGLEHLLHRRPGAMSGGQQQRVSIARALALDPAVVLADEPTVHLDYVQVDEVLHLLFELASDDRIVLIATHDQRLLPLAHQVVELLPERESRAEGPVRVQLIAGDVVFKQGSWGDLVYVIESGNIEIIAERIDGSYERRALLREGQYFGEIGALCHMPRSATAIAGTDAVVVGYGARQFRERLGAGPLLTAPYAPRRKPRGRERASVTSARRERPLRAR